MSKYYRKKTWPKGHTPEEEVLETARRIMKKYAESRKSARNSPEWLEFLDGIGIQTQTEKKSGFWEKVRKAVKPDRPIQKLIEQMPINYARAKVTVSKQGNYRDITTGRFVRKAYVRNVSEFSEKRLTEARVSIDKHERFRSNETGKYVSKQYVENN